MSTQKKEQSRQVLPTTCLPCSLSFDLSSLRTLTYGLCPAPYLVTVIQSYGSSVNP